MASIYTAPVSGPPMPAVSRILARYDRPHLAAFIEIAIGLLDTLDGPADPDEPDFLSRSDGLPGEPDDHEPSGDERDIAWPEWDQRGRRRQSNGTAEMGGCSEYSGGSNEDEEEDDPAEEGDHSGQCGEDGMNTVFEVHPARWRGLGPGCNISDPDFAADDIPCDDHETDQSQGILPDRYGADWSFDQPSRTADS